jgi:hypothetical protein
MQLVLNEAALSLRFLAPVIFAALPMGPFCPGPIDRADGVTYGDWLFAKAARPIMQLPLN